MNKRNWYNFISAFLQWLKSSNLIILLQIKHISQWFKVKTSELHIPGMWAEVLSKISSRFRVNWSPQQFALSYIMGSGVFHDTFILIFLHFSISCFLTFGYNALRLSYRKLIPLGKYLYTIVKMMILSKCVLHSKVNLIKSRMWRYNSTQFCFVFEELNCLFI